MLEKTRVLVMLAAICAVGTPAGAVCGDGVLDGEEQCDDGNTLPWDGCNQICRTRLCLAPAPTGCVPLEKGSLSVRERGEGDERTASLKLDLSRFGVDVPLADFGDPVTDETRYDVCIYGDEPEPYATLVVARGFDTCGPDGKERSCWRGLGATRYRYADPEWRSMGVTKMEILSGAAGKGRIRVAAKRTPDRRSMPFMTTQLEKDLAAKVVVMTSDGRCFDTVLPVVKANDRDAFRATSGE